MSGLIWSAMGRSISEAGNNIGSFMSRAIERDIEAERRAREREEDRRFRRELQEDAQAARADLSGARGAGTRGGSGSRGGDSGFDISEGGADEAILARRAGVTVPELRALRRYSETGDTAPFRRDEVVGGTTTEDPALAGEGGETSDAVSRKYAKRELEIAKTLPPGFEQFARSKAKALGEIEAGMRMGKDNKGFQDGESERFQRENAEAARDGRMKPGQAGLANAIIEGKPIFTVKGDEKLNQYTGDSDTTDVGDSKIRKNDRPPAPRGSSGGGGSPRNEPTERLTAQAETLRKAIDQATGERKKMLERQFDEVMSELRSRRTSSPSPTTPAAPAPGAPKKSFSHLWN